MLDGVLQALSAAISDAASALVGLFFAPSSQDSLFSLFTAGAIAALIVLARRKGELPFKVMLRAMFPRALFRSASCRNDVIYLLLNTLVFPAALAWIIVSVPVVTDLTRDGLAAFGGPRDAGALPAWGNTAAATLVLFAAYELAYWCDHALSHRVPFLWEFHKVHHTADRLTPLTNARVHPVDTALFANFVALYTGVAAGALEYVLGAAPRPLLIGDTNVLLVVFLHVTIHLQHTHFWIRFPGVFGRIFMSPAHHQIHHSEDPAHFNKNFGSCLAVWDWLFGTLCEPPRVRPELTFGAGPALARNHRLVPSLLDPFAAVLRMLRRESSLRQAAKTPAE